MDTPERPDADVPSTAGPRPAAASCRLIEGLRRAADTATRLEDVPAAQCASALGVSGVTVSVLTYDGTPEPVWSASEDWIGRELDDLQYVTGEGPAYDTARSGRAVLVPDLLEETDGRWHLFRPNAIRRGAAALFVFPVTFGITVGGVLSGYRTTPGHLTLQQVNGARFFAQAVALLLGNQLDTSIDDPSMPALVSLHRAEVHTAAGILAERFDIPVQQALDRLRAHAYGDGRPLRDVAHEVVSRHRRPNYRFPF